MTKLVWFRVKKLLKKKYQKISHLKNTFSKVLILAFLAIITLNALKYNCKLLQFWVYTWWYTELLYWLISIIKAGFKEFDYLITPITPIIVISKIIIFVANIDIARKIVIHLQGQFFAGLRNKTNMFIQVFFANLTLELQYSFW